MHVQSFVFQSKPISIAFFSVFVAVNVVVVVASAPYCL